LVLEEPLAERCPGRPVLGAKTGLADAVPIAGSMAVAKTPVSRVSLWKNEGKKRWRESFRGGLKGPDTLYDSKPKLTGFPFV
jgi:hypothetical protein